MVQILNSYGKYAVMLIAYSESEIQFIYFVFILEKKILNSDKTLFSFYTNRVIFFSCYIYGTYFSMRLIRHKKKIVSLHSFF